MAYRYILDKDDLDFIIREFEKGTRNSEIAKALNIPERILNVRIRRLKDEGKIDPVRKYKARTAPMRDKIIELYKQDVPISRIAIEADVSENTVMIVIRKAKEEGIIPNVRKRTRRKKEPASPKPKAPAQPRRRPADDDNETGGINCTLAVSLTCVYGCTNATKMMGLCNYCLIEKKMRRCSPKHCDKYIKISKEHPRPHILTSEKETSEDIKQWREK